MTGRGRAAALGVASVLVVLVAPSIVSARPTPLAGQDGCELFHGTVSGNDPSVLVELRLCPVDAGAVLGQLQWSSETSGWSRREIAGRIDGDRVVLRDVRMAEDRPNEGWRFCLVDRYELVRRSDALTGTYRSDACDDSASVNLRLARGEGPPSPGPPPAPAPGPAPSPSPSPGPAPAPAPGPAPAPAPVPAPAVRDTGCTAMSPSRGDTAAGLLALAVLALVSRRRR